MLRSKPIFIIAALAASTQSSALERTHDGTGDAILLPYYHAADGETTLLGVTNHSVQPKAVRIAVIEGRNGRPALTFNLYLAPRDTWSAAIVPGTGNANPRLITSEESCTAPQLTPGNAALRADAYSGSLADGLGTGADRLRQGSVEIIELGVPTGEAAKAVAGRQCSGLVARLLSGDWSTRPNEEMSSPTGGLTAQAQIVDVADGIMYRTDSVVLNGFSAFPRHGLPGAADPLNAVRFVRPTLSPADAFFEVGAARFDRSRGMDAVSLLMMGSAFEAGYLLTDTLAAQTRFVVTLPTRNAYLDDLAGGELPAGTLPRAPFADASRVAPYCVETDWQSVSMQGIARTSTVVRLCGQVNVVEIVAGQAGPGQYDVVDEVGRIRIGMRADRRTLSFAGGLPAVVHALTHVSNANAQQGMLASYAISHPVVREQQLDVAF